VAIINTVLVLNQKFRGFNKVCQIFLNLAIPKRAVKNAIKLYNEVRLRLSLGFKTPNMVYKLTA
jgi:hypothetical protein